MICSCNCLLLDPIETDQKIKIHRSTYTKPHYNSYEVTDLDFRSSRMQQNKGEVKMESNYEGLFFKENGARWEPTYVVYKKLPNGNYLVRYAEKYQDFLTNRVSDPIGTRQFEYGEIEMTINQLSLVKNWASTEHNANARVANKRKFEDIIYTGTGPFDFPQFQDMGD